jgi:predicted short-subunit dehydrogenase-like oxidoreductase (DUF2520 family)
MEIVIIGSGNLATQLSLALKEAGHNIVQVYSPTEQHAKTLAAKIDCAYTTAADEVRQDAEFYVIAIKDDAIRGIAATLSHKIGKAVIVHTAGSMPMDVFIGHASRYGVLYPMQTFSKDKKVDFREIPCFIEASDEQTLTVIRRLADSISDHVVEVDSEKRKKMHLAAVLACNLTNHCYRLAERVLEKEEIDFSLFLPLIRETAQKIETMSPKDAQTGPMVRYDKGVMNMQIEMLPDERTRQIYRLMAESIHEDVLTKQG